MNFYCQKRLFLGILFLCNSISLYAMMQRGNGLQLTAIELTPDQLANNYREAMQYNMQLSRQMSQLRGDLNNTINFLGTSYEYFNALEDYNKILDHEIMTRNLLIIHSAHALYAQQKILEEKGVEIEDQKKLLAKKEIEIEKYKKANSGFLKKTKPKSFPKELAWWALFTNHLHVYREYYSSGLTIAIILAAFLVNNYLNKL